MAVTVNQVNTQSDTFDVWIQQTNLLIADLASLVLTANINPNGSFATGNSYLVGILGVSDTLAANNVRGGNVQTSANLNLTSNVTVTGNWINFPALIAPGTVNVSSNLSLNTTTSFVSVGNVTVNAVVNSTSFTLANSTLSWTVKLPTFAQTTQPTAFLHANGSWVQGATGNVSANTLADIYLSFGSASINAVVNSTSFKLANSTLSLAIKLPTAVQQAGQFFLHANGSWVNGATGNVSANVMADMFLSFGAGTTNAVVNATSVKLSTPSSALTIGIGYLTYAGLINVNSNVWMNTVSSYLSVGNVTVNTAVNSTSFALANGTVVTQYLIDRLTGVPAYVLDANVRITGSLTIDSGITYSSTANAISFGSATVNTTINAVALVMSNTVANTELDNGILKYSGVTFQITSNLMIASAAVYVGNGTTNAVVNTTSVKLAAPGTSMEIDVGVIKYTGNLSLQSNVSVTGGQVSVGAGTTNVVTTNTGVTLANSTASMALTIGSIVYAANLQLGNVDITGIGGRAAFGVGATTNSVINSTALLFSTPSTTFQIDVGEILYAGLINTNANLSMNTATSTLFIGNTIANAVINSTSHTIANASIALGLGLGYLTYPGLINTTANLSMNTITSTLSVGNGTVNTVANSTVQAWNNPTANLVIGAGFLTYAGLINTNANLSMNTATSTLFVGNTIVNAIINSTSYSLANASVAMAINLGSIVYPGLINVTANVMMNTDSGWIGAGNVTVNSYMSGAGFNVANSTVSLAIRLPTLVQQASLGTFLHANGSWVGVPPASINANTLQDAFLGFGVTTTNAVINSTSVDLFSPTVNTTLTTTALRFVNATVDFSYTPPTATQLGTAYTFLAANGSWLGLSSVFEPYGQISNLSTKTISYVLVLGDKGGTIEFNSASALTCTVPNNATVAFPVNSIIDMI